MCRLATRRAGHSTKQVRVEYEVQRTCVTGSLPGLIRGFDPATILRLGCCLVARGRACVKLAAARYRPAVQHASSLAAAFAVRKWPGRAYPGDSSLGCKNNSTARSHVASSVEGARSSKRRVRSWRSTTAAREASRALLSNKALGRALSLMRLEAIAV